MSPSPVAVTFARKLVAEGIGTFILVFFGCGSVHAAVLTGAQQGVWQVAIVWAVGIMLAIFAVGGVSGAHLNPAMTLAFALWRRFPWKEVPGYMASQLVGAFTAAATLFVIFGALLAAKEASQGVVRGEAGSIVTAMCYGEYFPNPGVLAAGDDIYSTKAHERLRTTVPLRAALVAEVLGTLLLSFVVFALTDERNPGRPAGYLAPVLIGLTVAALISVIGPLTQACFNPARDVGPRLFAAIAGWGRVAWPGLTDLSWLTVYIVAPLVGASLGGGLYQYAVRPAAPDCCGEVVE